MALLRARDGRDRRHGRVAHVVLRRLAGAAHIPERAGEFSGAARRTDGAVCGARGRLVRTVAVGPRRGEQGHAPRDHGPRAIHIGVGQPRRPSRGRDRGESHQPASGAYHCVDRLVEERDAEPYPGANRTGSGTALRRDGALLSIALCAWYRRRTLAGSERAGVRSAEGRRRRLVRAPRASRRTAAAWRSSSDSKGNGTWRSCLQTAPTHEPWLRPSTSKAVAGQGTADWSPDGDWIVTGGDDGQGKGLFKIPVDGGGEPVRLLAGEARGPVWSPNGDLIVYASPTGRRSRRFGRAPWCETGRHPCRDAGGAGPPGWSPPFPAATVRAWCIVPEALNPRTSGCSISSRTRTVSSLDLADRGYLNTFDITPDGKYLVFDRTRQNSDIVLIDLPKK